MMAVRKSYKRRLFSKSPTLSGIATIFNIWGNFYTHNYTENPRSADARALASDWEIVGKDMWEATESIRVNLNIHVNSPSGRKLSRGTARLRG
ncbi:hypothetical protein GCM10011511_32830 [Puia dinghuensis]|uniref:Uncharacterized protein n=1 Tax=Puia dinghuensis TaxID=1792502 RepID=A0A8J2UEK4_9BACT|nr:hypothetical protein GCM10011511_32830 [Puia dinghuensis]